MHLRVCVYDIISGSLNIGHDIDNEVMALPVKVITLSHSES